MFSPRERWGEDLKRSGCFWKQEQMNWKDVRPEMVLRRLAKL